MKRLILTCCIVIFFVSLIGCSRILTERNVNNTIQNLLNAEKLSNLRNAKEWEVEIFIRNEYGELSFLGEGDSFCNAKKNMIDNKPVLDCKD